VCWINAKIKSLRVKRSSYIEYRARGFMIADTITILLTWL
jgi:hypothetical protein